MFESCLLIGRMLIGCISCRLILAALAGLMVEPALAQSPHATLHLRDAHLTKARLTEITSDGRWQFQTQESKAVTSAEIVRWSPPVAVQPQAAVCLLDGSWLAGSIQWISENSCRVNSEWFEPVELTLDQMRGMILQPSPAWSQSLELHNALAVLDGTEDTIWNASSQQLRGVLTIKWRAGTSATPARPTWLLQPTAGANQIELNEADLRAVAFSPVLRKPLSHRRTSPLLTLRDGSRLLLHSIGRVEDRVRVELVSGIVLKSFDSSDQFVAAVAAITNNPTGVQWLSEIEPARYRLLDDSRLAWPLGRDKDLFGRSIFVQDLPVEHGLVIHAPAQVAYRWDGRKGKLLAELQLWFKSDASVQETASAECQVMLGKNGELVPAFRSDVLRSATPPALIDVDVTGAQLIVLLVDQADQGSLGDHLLWRDARLVTDVESKRGVSE